MIRINTRSAVLSLALLLSASAAFAAENPRGKQDPAERRNVKSLKELTLVVDPNGPGKPGSEAMHYLVTRESLDKDVLYGFTTLEGREQYIASQERRTGEMSPGLGQAVEGICTDARFNKVAYGTGTDWLNMYCGQTNPYLNDDWNDVISYAEASGSWTILYKCYYFSTSGSCSTLTMQGGSTIQDLNVYGFNNYTSSIKVCPEGITFTECQSY
ncbi:MAG: hypothetical protein ABUT39_08185 [Acidobacteriota bacterium]